ncbi:helix-hairpin-helix domain-containing protein [Planococcus sp. CP5-4]|uniref:helix-hairpin-helix domain-containing protein n=1 Tax=unclassified Planococcus (in: firmicutes) TaxID=2662419 RepID=UPI001C235EDD|nr:MULTISPECIES: helix-hairpin-helix domain-containing protein [unclassified Planococcus (in: firmicutes)]MBU9672836.1 helix-hairpin-helix domain-containing protein [Planococcus sp. CP5-4_YE]MBV0908608.1 helix-hairpin-helix domain-containing protein [Planococcus sp. CP5-4_UN]MBW6063377.1 helix-hairpin-helix domain-containing protein [Planococcus sp. CP5-4]
MSPQLAKYSRIIVPIAAVLALLYFFLLHEPPEATSLDELTSETIEQPPPPEPDVSIPTSVMIDVKGAVQNAGLYELPAGSRINDAIDAAGGFLPEADTRSINLAVIVIDESSVYVPKQGEESPAQAAAMPGGSTEPGLINLNSATEDELTELPGIGPAKAAAIVAHRTENGPFKNTEQLMDVTGIGEKSFEQLKELVRVR